MINTKAGNHLNPSQRITDYIADLGDWRGVMVARLRQLILEAAPGVTEAWKWNSPVWTHNGNVVSVGAFKDHVKANFFNGASLDDPYGLFNAGLDAKRTRSIDLREGDEINAVAFQDLVRTAVALNIAGAKRE